MVNIVDLPTNGSFFKPAEYADAAALLIEVTNFERQLPTTYGPKDTVTATITAFRSAEDIDAGRNSVNAGVKIQQVDLARRLEGMVGSATVVRLEKLEATAKLPNGAWVWRQVASELVQKVVAYVEKRDAEADEALGELPDFSAA